MTLSCEVNDRARLVPAEEVGDQAAIVDVPTNEFVARMVRDRSKIRGIASVGKTVEIYDAGGFVLQPLQEKVAADKSSTSGNDDCV
jgi:hypothetical protein